MSSHGTVPILCKFRQNVKRAPFVCNGRQRNERMIYCANSGVWRPSIDAIFAEAHGWQSPHGVDRCGDLLAYLELGNPLLGGCGNTISYCQIIR